MSLKNVIIIERILNFKELSYLIYVNRDFITKIFSFHYHNYCCCYLKSVQYLKTLHSINLENIKYFHVKSATLN